MRVEPYTVGSYVHVIKRGARGLDIVRDESDKWRFIRTLYFMNEKFFDQNWMLSTKSESMFFRPEQWPERKPLVEILCYTLLPNHFHLLFREIQENGMSQFMKKLGQSMTNHANQKYEERGSLFQGSYRSKTMDSDEYLRYVAAYIMVKNTFELYPQGGLTRAQRDFEAAWQWSITYPFSSLGDYADIRRTSPILTKGLLAEIFTPTSFKDYAYEVILSGKWKEEEKELE